LYSAMLIPSRRYNSEMIGRDHEGNGQKEQERQAKNQRYQSGDQGKQTHQQPRLACDAAINVVSRVPPEAPKKGFYERFHVTRPPA
jgi:hypothetical protein